MKSWAGELFGDSEVMSWQSSRFAGPAEMLNKRADIKMKALKGEYMIS